MPFHMQSNRSNLKYLRKNVGLLEDILLFCYYFVTVPISHRYIAFYKSSALAWKKIPCLFSHRSEPIQKTTFEAHYKMYRASKSVQSITLHTSGAKKAHCNEFRHLVCCTAPSHSGVVLYGKMYLIYARVSHFFKHFFHKSQRPVLSEMQTPNHLSYITSYVKVLLIPANISILFGKIFYWSKVSFYICYF